MDQTVDVTRDAEFSFVVNDMKDGSLLMILNMEWH